MSTRRRRVGGVWTASGAIEVPCHWDNRNAHDMNYAQCFDDLERWRDRLRRERSGPEVIRQIEDRIKQESDPLLMQILGRFLADEHDAQGNPAAADAVRRADPEQEILRWRDDWRERHAENDLVRALEDRVQQEFNPLKLHALRGLLAREHRKRRNYGAAEAVYLADFEADPARPQALFCLARQKFNDENQPDVAMRIVDRALAAALHSGIFRRKALGLKARIALTLQSYATVDDVLRHIMRLTFTKGNLDVEVERDFLDRAPPGCLDAEVARAYDAYCRARGKVSTASDEEIDELILRLARPRWQKMAMIAGKALNEFRARQLDANEHAVAERVRAMVEAGRLAAQGNISCLRRSEIRLPG